MKTKHTKGNWITVANGSYIVVKTENWFDSDRHLYVSVMLYDDRNNDLHFSEENKANADVIAAAPEMLEAMQLFVDLVERGEIRSKKTYASFQEMIKKDTP